MAYALPSFSAAANYAASFRPVKPVEGFENVKSDAATALLSSIPLQNQKMGQKMAERALAEQGALKRTQIREEGATERRKMYLDTELELADKRIKNSKRAAMLQRLGSTGAMQIGRSTGGASRVRAGGGGSSLLDPMKQLVSFDNLSRGLEGNRNGRLAPIHEAGKKAIEGLPAAGGGTAKQPAAIAPQGAYAAPKPGELSPIDISASGLDSEQVKKLMERFEQQGG